MKRFFLFFLCVLYAFGAKAEESVWEKIYKEASQSYLYEITIEDLAVAALKGLKEIDKSLALGNDGSRVSLYYQGQVATVRQKPKNKNDAKAWGLLTEDVVAAAVLKSPHASRRDFEINELIAAEMVKVLDKDSKFYTDIEETGGVSKYSRRRQFAARLEEKMLYMKIGAFNKQTFNEVKQALGDYSFAPMLIIDLQGCPGGMAGEAVRVADLFLDGGIIASVQGKNKNEETYYNADDEDVWQGKPIFILIDGITASAAEILTKALQEQGRATIIGTKSKGKGTMQKLISLQEGGVLAITSGVFMAPSGEEINGKGILPDVCTFEMPATKNIDRLLKEQDGSCGLESREDNRLELEVIKALAKK